MAGTTLLGYPTPLETLPPTGLTPERTAAAKRPSKSSEGRRGRSTSSGRAFLDRPRVPSGKSRLPARAGLWGRRNTAGEIEPETWVLDGEAGVDANERPSRRSLVAVGVCVSLGIVGAIAALATRPPAATVGSGSVQPSAAAVRSATARGAAPSKTPTRTIVAAPEPAAPRVRQAPRTREPAWAPRPVVGAPAGASADRSAVPIPGAGSGQVVNARSAEGRRPLSNGPSAAGAEPAPAQLRARRAGLPGTRAERPARQPDLDADAVLEPSF